MNKKIIIYCSFILTALLMTGCGCGRTNEQPLPSTVPETNTTTTEPTQPATSQTQDGISTMITPEDAKAIALAHADLVAEEVTFSKCELDKDFDGDNYDVEFYTEDRVEYDYEIDAYTGDIRGYDWDGDDTLFSDSMDNEGTNATENTYSSDNSPNPTNSIITEDAAKKIALEQVPGSTEEHLREIDRDFDNGKLKYEIEIFYENQEYTFDINAKDGSILEREQA